jgi:diacylglycerol kinase (ATP)
VRSCVANLLVRKLLALIPSDSRVRLYERIKEPDIKITLIDNPTAGNHKELSSDETLRLLRNAGHKVTYQSSKEKKWKKVLKKSCDLVAVSGGDGTVGKVARLLLGSRIPIAILPMGTANNIATMLGIVGRSPQELIKGWPTARPVNFDVGVAKGPWGTEHFIEGFGVGLFAETMTRLDESKDVLVSDDPAEAIPKIVGILNDQVKTFDSKEMVVQLDGKDISGDYVLLEALNIRYIGPNLELGPHADISDGLLDIVTVTQRQRDKLKRHLSGALKDKGRREKLSVRRGQHLQIEWQNSPIHVDDWTWPKRKDETPLKSNAIHITVDPAALVFLTPPTDKRRPAKRRTKPRV